MVSVIQCVPKKVLLSKMQLLEALKVYFQHTLLLVALPQNTRVCLCTTGHNLVSLHCGLQPCKPTIRTTIILKAFIYLASMLNACIEGLLGAVSCDIIHCMCEIRPRCYHGDLVSLPTWKEEHCHPVAGRALVRRPPIPATIQYLLPDIILGFI